MKLFDKNINGEIEVSDSLGALLLKHNKDRFFEIVKVIEEAKTEDSKEEKPTRRRRRKKED